ncbi:MAG: hypothetical protein AVDCRST_MAG88-16, partial [uncultured Thermomicrobiales bacterium]
WTHSASKCCSSRWVPGGPDAGCCRGWSPGRSALGPGARCARAGPPHRRSAANINALSATALLYSEICAHGRGRVHQKLDTGANLASNPPTDVS